MTTTGEALGNISQAFIHVALIHTARNLDLALSQREKMRVDESASESNAT